LCPQAQRGKRARIVALSPPRILSVVGSVVTFAEFPRALVAGLLEGLPALSADEARMRWLAAEQALAGGLEALAADYAL
jgi:hypothetical protein